VRGLRQLRLTVEDERALRDHLLAFLKAVQHLDLAVAHAPQFHHPGLLGSAALVRVDQRLRLGAQHRAARHYQRVARLQLDVGVGRLPVPQLPGGVVEHDPDGRRAGGRV
jgi:hypothetical protein